MAATYTVSSNVTSTNVSVGANQTLDVLSGGTVIATSITALGSATIEAGGTASGTHLSGSPLRATQSAYQTVYGTASGTQIFSRGYESVTSGGTAFSTVVSKGGDQDVGASGMTSGTIVSSGGVQLVIGAGAHARGTIISTGGTQTVATGEADSATILSGGLQTVTGPNGVASGTIVSSGGTEYLSDATAISFNAQVLSGGSLVVSTGETDGTTVFRGGIEVVYSGASAFGTVLSGGIIVALPGADVEDTAGGDVTSTGVVIISGTNHQASYATAISGGTISGTAVYVLSQGSLTDVTANAPIFVYNGGTTTGTVLSGSTEYLYNGAIGSNTQLLGGFLYVSAGATATGTIISAGQEAINSGGAASETLVYGGNQIVNPSGTATSTTIFAGGAQTVQQGTVISTVISSGGVQTLIGGATASGTIVSSGGVEIIGAQSVNFGSNTVIGTDVLSGGRIVINSGNNITGLDVSSGGSIDLNYLIYDAADTVDVTSGGLLTVTSAGTPIYSLQLAGDYTGDYFHTSADTDNSLILTEDTNPCYCPGTLIATDKGEVAVETLAIGDRLLTRSGEMRPIKWIGRRSYGGRFLMGRADLMPIRIMAGALEDNVPARDLFVSPHHAMYIDGVLIETKDLVNGTSIVQSTHAESVTYYHVELESHDVILAEGAWAESFLDEDNRGMFHNAHEYAALYPDEESVLGCYCAPRLEDGFELEAIRGKINRRAPRMAKSATA